VIFHEVFAFVMTDHPANVSARLHARKALQIGEPRVFRQIEPLATSP
jgi:hypothetical protein